MNMNYLIFINNFNQFVLVDKKSIRKILDLLQIG